MLIEIIKTIPWYTYILIYLFYILIRVVPFILGNKINDKKFSTGGYIKTQGVISGYYNKTKKRKVKDNETGLIKEEEYVVKLPIVSYIGDEKTYDYKVNLEFAYELIMDYTGYELPIYYKQGQPSIAKVKYNDIYKNEIEQHKKSMNIILIIGAVASIGFTTIALILK